MDGSRFDELARTLVGRSTRRTTMKAAGGIVAGGIMTALGFGKSRAYNDKCERFILSGGNKPTKVIDVDDDLAVYLNGERIFNDHDGIIGINLEPIDPIKFRAQVGDKLRIVAKDGEGPCRSLSALWLHCRDGGEPVRLTRGVEESCDPDRPPRKFFDDTFKI
jgi:hypothetical protein